MNLYRKFEVQSRDEKLALNTEWVLYTFNITDDRTKEYFIDELKKSFKSDTNMMVPNKQIGTVINSVSAPKF